MAQRVARPRRGDSISARAGGTPALAVKFQISGVDKTTSEFKQIRKEINGTLRDAQENVGTRVVLPFVKARFTRRAASSGVRGMKPGAMAQSLYVKRDRLDVYIGSRLRGKENRALGWIDFGGRRRGERAPRIGPRAIIGTLVERQPQIRDQIQDAVMDAFAKNFDVS